MEEQRRIAERQVLSLRWRLVSIAVAALVPTVAVLAYNEASLRRSRTAEVHELALRSARLANSELARIIEGAQNVMQALAAFSAVREFGPGCNETLVRVAGQLDQLATISIMDQAGTVRCGSRPELGNLSVREQPWFTRTLATAAPQVGQFVAPNGALPAMLPVTWPLRDDKGVTVAVLVAGIDLGWLGSRLKERGLSRDGALTVADGAGVIVSRDPLPERFVGTSIPAPFMRLVRASEPGTEAVISQDGTSRVIGFIPPKASGIDLYISAGLSQGDSFQAIDRATWLSVASIAIAAVLSLALAWWTGEKMIREPVAGLLARMRAWSRGEPLPEVHLQPRSSEVAELGEAFERLVGEIDRREQERNLLLQELEHRIKNNSSMVQSIAHQTLKGRVTPEIMAALNARLSNLARAHEVLTRSAWASADLEEIVRATIMLQPGARRIRANGPSLRLPPRAALGLALVLHELTTNAVKYGALSNDTGHVGLSWQVTPRADGSRHLDLTWQERDGPPVQPPQRRGFGATMIARALAGELNGTTDTVFEPGGLVCRIAMDLPVTDAASAEPPARGPIALAS